MKKKALSFILSLTLLAALVSGCASKEPAPAESAAPAQASSAQSPAPSESPAAESAAPAESTAPEQPSEAATPTAITYPVANGDAFSIAVVMDTNFVNYLPDGNPANASAVKLFSERTGVNLEYTIFSMQSDSLTLMLASGDMTDLVNKINENYASGVSGALDDEVIIDLAPLIDENCPDFSAYLNSNPSFVKSAYTDSGKLGSLCSFSAPMAAGMVIRQDWLDEVQMAVPETYSQFEDVCKAVLAKHDLDSCLPMSANWIATGYECTEMMYGLGFVNDFFVNTDGQVEFCWTSDEGREYIEMMNRWGQLGIVNYDQMLNGVDGDIGQYIFTDQALIYRGGPEYLGESMLYLAADPDFKLSPVNFLTRTPGETVHFGGGESTVAVGWSVTSSCKDPELLLKACNWFYTEEGTIAMNFGTEGEGYTMDENGKYHYTDLVTNNPQGIPSFIATGVYTAMEGIKIGMAEATEASFTTDAQYQALDFWNGQPRDNSGVMRGALTVEENEQVSKIFTDIDTYVQENVMKMVVGDLSIADTWDKFCQEIKSMNIDTVVADYQAAYDRYQSK